MKAKSPSGDFRSFLKELSHSRDTRQVFDAFVCFAACALATGTREDEYLEEAKRWEKPELNLFAKAFALLISEMETRPFEDLIGSYYRRKACVVLRFIGPVMADARGVGKNVASGDLLAFVGKLGDVGADVGVEIDLPCLDQLHDGNGGDCFTDGSEAIDGFRLIGRLVLQVGIAEPLREIELAVLGDRDRCASDFCRRHVFLDCSTNTFVATVGDGIGF